MHSPKPTLFAAVLESFRTVRRVRRDQRMLRSMSGEGERIAQTTPRLSSTLQREWVGATLGAVIGQFSGA